MELTELFRDPNYIKYYSFYTRLNKLVVHVKVNIRVFQRFSLVCCTPLVLCITVIGSMQNSPPSPAGKIRSARRESRPLLVS